MNTFLKLIDPYRWLIGGLLVFALLAGVAMAYRSHANGLREEGRAEVRAEWDKSKAQAQAVQDTQTDTAVEALVQEVEVIKTVYRDRIKEVKVYVPNPATTCPADHDFVRLFNAAR